MAYDGSITLSTNVDQSGLNKGLTSIKSGISAITGAVTKLGVALGIAFGVGQLIKFGKEAITLASDLEEVQNVVDVAFGNMKYKIEDFSKTAIEQFGISELTAKKTASTYMAMAKGMGINAESGSDMAIQLTALSADMASFYNVSQEMADTALKSVFTGETETLKQYGIVMTEVNLQEQARQLGITKSIDKMTQQEKTMLRYQYVLNQTQLAQGDFARTQDSWANQTRILSQRWQQVQTQFGKTFKAIATLFLPVINTMITGLGKVAEYAQVAAQFIYKAFTGRTLQVEQTQTEANALADTVGSQEDLTSAVKATNKEQKKALANFDTINKIAEETADTQSDIATGASGGNIDSGITTKESGQSFDSSGIESFFDRVSIALQPAINAFNNLWNALLPFGETVGSGLKWLYDNVLLPFSEWTISELLPTFLNTLASAVSFLNTVVDIAKEPFENFYNKFLKPIAEWTGGKIVEILDLINAKIQDFTLFMQENGADIELILTTIGNAFGFLWENVIKKILDFAMLFIKERFDNIYRFIKGIIQTIIDLFSGIIKFVDGVFTGDWEKAWQGVQQIFKGIWDGLVNIVRFPINIIISLINGLVRGVLSAVNYIIQALNKISFDVPDWVPGIGGQKFGFNLSEINIDNFQIPKLAKGGVLYSPSVVQVAEYAGARNNPEIISPENKMRQIFSETLASAGAYTGEIVLKIQNILDGNVLSETVERVRLDKGTNLATVGANF